MRLGVECLLTDDVERARHLAERLDGINRERRELQAGMVAEAEVMAAGLDHIEAVGVALYEPSWHAGVVGLVASKLKERLHRPVIAFAPASEDDPTICAVRRDRLPVSISATRLRPSTPDNRG